MHGHSTRPRHAYVHMHTSSKPAMYCGTAERSALVPSSQHVRTSTVVNDASIPSCEEIWTLRIPPNLGRRGGPERTRQRHLRRPGCVIPRPMHPPTRCSWVTRDPAALSPWSKYVWQSYAMAQTTGRESLPHHPLSDGGRRSTTPCASDPVNMGAYGRPSARGGCWPPVC